MILMLSRILTGLLLAPLVVLLFLIGPEALRVGVVLLASGIAFHEFFAMTLPDRRMESFFGIFLGVAVLTSMHQIPGSLEGNFLAMIFVPALVVVLRPRPIESAMQRLFVLWAAMVYIVLPFKYALLLSTQPEPWILLVLTTVWAGDTGAYFAGKFLGKHLLHPIVSPKKTIEGAIGGLVASVGLGLLAVFLLDLPLSSSQTVLLCLLGGAIGQVGDLTESLIKRACKVKDSGKLLPGHGGLLDRIDGVLFAFPLFGLMLGIWHVI